MGDFDPRVAATERRLADKSDFVLGGLTVRPSYLSVQRDGIHREMQPRVMCVLQTLAEARPHPVTREQLFEHCWDGRVVSDDALNRCILQLRHLTQEFSPPPFEIKTVPRVGYRLIENPQLADATPITEAPPPTRRSPFRAWVGAITAIVFAVSVAWLVALPNASSAGPNVPRILVVGSDGSDASNRMSGEVRDMVSALPPGQGSAVDLLGPSSGSQGRPDYLLEVVAPKAGTQEARAALLSATDRKVLWSARFRSDRVSTSDLIERISYAVAGALACAPGKRDAPQRLSEYVAACTALTTIGYDPMSSVQVLRQVVTDSPRFLPGWASLLQAELDSLTLVTAPRADRMRLDLARHAEEALRLKPNLAEALIARARLTPMTRQAERLKLLEAAVVSNPDHAIARLARSEFLFSVGLVNDSVQDTQAAVRLAPASLRVRLSYVYSLATAGHLQAAFSELAKVERLWPGLRDIDEARLLLELRYGDPKRAEALLEAGSVELGAAVLLKPYLKARLEPSAPNEEVALSTGRNLVQQYPETISAHLQALAAFDRRDELFDLLSRGNIGDPEGVTDVIFRPTFTAVHRDPRFMQVAKRFGLLAFWRESGRWPDFCLAPDLPYRCDVEAARLMRG
ncbi:winged helix-turn-helix domain-containing protein [Sphingomonas arenae]|uniref:winged helix-turn-helix domain-containing protein n=1 Tax=Sphingomonas arenae TaxID=2812555 RepID=UPI001966D620|nr:winged helix-turn-helix domain-containing protein [Sphingomonas arenae]